ncbi:hypothetical protein CFC21_035917 [Triticum aestivum]|uniref:Uncharacterized protein n=2 Tax=Triticum aestivum TaxID=4565 RepID=A0A9R1F753_WHEAT|nr:hypothetical protein CFC21_035917 [Triticum aestivum]
MVSMAAAADDDHDRRRIANLSPSPSDAPAPAQPHRRRLHSFSFPTLSWGTHRLLRCSKDPASAPPPPPPHTPSPDKEMARRSTDGGAGGGSPQRPPQRPWNLRTRRSATAAPGAVGPEAAADAAAEHAPARPAQKRGFSIVLSKEEIAQDFAFFRGTRPPRRPKKRSRPMQRQLDVRIGPAFVILKFSVFEFGVLLEFFLFLLELQSLCPGLSLVDLTPDSYKIEER